MPAPAAFVMPHLAEASGGCRYLVEAVEGIASQSDPDWQLVIVDDASPSGEARNALESIAHRFPGQVTILAQKTNRGPGVCRNLGVEWAYAHGAPFVLFNDADDVSHPSRLERVREVFSARPEVGMVYSRFVVIDEDSRERVRTELTPSIREILESLDSEPPEGLDCWIEVGTSTGYVTLTSTVAVRTDLLRRFPFPEERVSEDSHTWYRLCASGQEIAFAPTIPSRYRIPREVAGSHTRKRLGSDFYRHKARVDIAGFREATRIALSRASVTEAEAVKYFVRFLERLARTMEREQQLDVADAVRSLAARSTSQEIITAAGCLLG